MHKAPIDWHEQCLKHTLTHLDNQERLLNCAQIALEKNKNEALAYAEQIQLAKNQGKTEFDRDRFGKKRK